MVIVFGFVSSATDSKFEEIEKNSQNFNAERKCSTFEN